MFAVAILLALYSYVIFFLGLAGLLYRNNIALVTFIYIGCSLYYFRGAFGYFLNVLIDLKKYLFLCSKIDRIYLIFLSLLFLQAIINLVGALGPELGFDALWYHLTIPKIYLANHKIFFIQGGLLYYSAMPKLAEMYYISSLAVQGEILAKLTHYTFGVLSVVALFLFSRTFFSKRISLLITLMFYSNLVVAWESITAYVDLTRAFFEIMALWAFTAWWKDNKKSSLVILGLMVGFTVGIKLLALGSFMIFTLLIIFKNVKKYKGFCVLIFDLLIFWSIILTSILPWFIFSLINTGNPIYPIFGGYNIALSTYIFSPIRFIYDIFIILLLADDPVSPIYLICLPLIVLYFKNFRTPMKIVGIYSLTALIVWYFTPRTGGGRFMMPYLPSFSILIGEVIILSTNKKILKSTIISCVIIISCISIIYRGMANFKYLSVILGIKSKDEFIAENLNFSFGDFYDTDGYFRKNINSSDKVLLYGFHNLYYVNFPFIESSWIKEGDKFNYVAVQSAELPKRFSNWKIIYSNPMTRVSVYTRNKGFYSY